MLSRSIGCIYSNFWVSCAFYCIHLWNIEIGNIKEIDQNVNITWFWHDVLQSYKIMQMPLLLLLLTVVVFKFY